MKLQLLLIAACLCVASAGIPKKLFKKYAMKKVMESCFGEQLLSDIKQEVVAACEKCHGEQSPQMPQLRDQMTAMFAGSEYSAKPAQYRHAVQYVPVPVQFQPVAPQYQSRWKRSHHGKMGLQKFAMLRNKISSIVGNVTCVMKEMKMLDAENQVDFDSIKQRIMSMPLPKEMLDDLHQGMEQCREFSSCLPSSIFEKTPVTAGFGKQIAFFKCFKMAKIESCMKQEFREDYYPKLMKAGIETDEDESFQTLITSALLEEEGDM